MVMGTALELSNSVEVLEKEDFRPRVVITDFAGECDRVGGLESILRVSRRRDKARSTLELEEVLASELETSWVGTGI